MTVADLGVWGGTSERERRAMRSAIIGYVLDVFAGTGTTLAVADLHGRDAIGIDIDARNQQLYEQRRAECARNLFDSPMPDANQLDLFGGVA